MFFQALIQQSRGALAARSAETPYFRSMATLRDIRHSIRTVSKIQKITKSMKMVSGAKYKRCEKELRSVKGLEAGLKEFSNSLKTEESGLVDATSRPKKLIIALSSDRGFCGDVHSKIIKHIKAELANDCNPENVKLVLIGEKMKFGFQLNYAKNILFSVSDVSKVNISPQDTFLLSDLIYQSNFKFDVATVVFNQFVSPISNKTVALNIYNEEILKKLKNYYDYDDLTDETLHSVCEFHMASTLLYAFRQSAASEQSARMAAMENSTKNADEMIRNLQLLFNRTRQSIITRELIEIISGAATIEADKK